MMNNVNKYVDVKSRPLWQADYQYYDMVRIQDFIEALQKLFDLKGTKQ